MIENEEQDSWTRTKGEHEFIFQTVEEYELNGYRQPDGEGWEFGTAVITEGKVISLWHRQVQVTIN